MRRLSLMLVLTAAVLVPAAPAQAHDTSCLGLGPALPNCDNGQHVRGGEFIQHGPDFQASAHFTGTIESYLISPSGNVLRTCDFVLGRVERCFTDVFSTWPKVGETFRHVCFSYFLGTEIHGGIGPWECEIRHD